MTTPEERFTVLYERYYEAVSKYVARRVADPDVSDVVANVFLAAWRRLPDIPQAEPLPWLYGTARRLIANNTRSKRRRQKLVDKLRNQSVEIKQDHTNAVARRLDVAAAFDRLSEKDQEVVRLVAWERLEPAQAAKALGCSRTTFAMRLVRARKRLRQQLDENPGAKPTLRQHPATTTSAR